jgi:hypothetical protein
MELNGHGHELCDDEDLKENACCLFNSCKPENSDGHLPSVSNVLGSLTGMSSAP